MAVASGPHKPDMIVTSSKLWLLLALFGATALSAAAVAPALEYNRDIRPILSENCFACHGPDSSSRKAKLRLDRFEDATTAAQEGVPAIIPGQPDKSEFIRRIFDESDDIMPPVDSHKVLTEAQKMMLKRWVAAGATYQPQWSLIAPLRPALPAVKFKDWVRNPIDTFILARIEREKLRPAPEADRRLLARRVSLDLTGLPPAPEVVDAFVRDSASNAYEQLVDQLLASPQWGEHRARYWLDAARYADTHGIHFDNFREMWTYRDWVIKAFNTNMPFDRFTVEQLAGDLLPNATLDQQIASGFNRCNITTSEGGAIEEEYLALYARDRTDTSAQVWLGLTAGCAVCHDHKYDPLSQKEYYQLSAFFNNTTQKAMDGNRKDTPPIIVVPKPEDRPRWEALRLLTNSAAKNVTGRREAARPDFERWRQTPDLTGLEKALPSKEILFVAPLSEGAGGSLSVEVAGKPRVLNVGEAATWQNGAITAMAWTTATAGSPEFADVGQFERDQKFSVALWIKPGTNQTGAVVSRMREGDLQRGWDVWLEEGRPSVHLVNAWSDNAILVSAKKPLPPGQWSHLTVTYDGASKAEGVTIFVNAEEQPLKLDKNSLTKTIQTESPLLLGRRQGGVALEGVGLQDLRIYSGAIPRTEVLALAQIPRMKWLVQRPVDGQAREEKEELYQLWLAQVDREYQQLTETRNRLDNELRDIARRGSIAHVMQERDEAAAAYVLFRGEYDKRRDKVMPGTPAALPPLPPELPRNRLGFAQWLIRPEHPLTARVTVNRFWQELFGTGLVATAGDFGVAGETPSHPELLDWLAVEFRDSGWNVKHVFKLMVMSATYRQSATLTPEKLARDPQNRLLARGPRFRMDAEMVRDHALAASGLLVNKVGGPSVKPYQPSGLWEVVGMPASDTRNYQADTGENLYRRSVYTFWKRMAPPASLEIFNAPSRETCTVRRERTDTPLQALVTLNDPQYVEAARKLAERALAAAVQESERLDYMARRLIARPLHSPERKILTRDLHYFLEHYRSSPKAATELLAVGDAPVEAPTDKSTLAAYTVVASQLMNLDEVLNK